MNFTYFYFLFPQVKDKVEMVMFDTKTGQIEHSVNTITKDVRMAEESVSSVRKEVTKKITKTEVESVVDDAMEVLKAEAASAKDLDGLSAGYFKCLSCDSVHEEMHTKPSRVNTNKMLGPAAMSPPVSRGSTPQQGAMRPPLGNGYASGGQMMGNTSGDVRALHFSFTLHFILMYFVLTHADGWAMGNRAKRACAERQQPWPAFLQPAQKRAVHPICRQGPAEAAWLQPPSVWC
jgi:hypothetical protein